MAIAPAVPLVPVDEYLTTSYCPDVEFVDGVLIEKGMPTIFHQLLSAILLWWFRQYETGYRIKALADVRTQIIERARYRLPDVMVFTTPAPLTRIMTRVLTLSSRFFLQTTGRLICWPALPIMKSSGSAT